MWCVLVGVAHPLVGELRACWQELLDREKELERVVPQNPNCQFLIPALLARWCQVDMNVWLQDQAWTNAICPVPSLMDVFGETQQKCDWAPDAAGIFPITHSTMGSAGHADPTNHTMATPNCTTRATGATLATTAGCHDQSEPQPGM